MTSSKSKQNYSDFDTANLQATLRYYYKKNPYNIPADLIKAIRERYPDWTVEWGHYFTAPGTRKHKGTAYVPQVTNPEIDIVAPTMHVTIIQKKSASGKMYNTITVNGIPLIKKHSQTRLKALLGGQYLGIYGVPAGQSEPTWLVFDTKLHQRPTEAVNDPQIKVQQIYDSPRLTRLVLNNRINVMLEYNKKKNTKFLIDPQHTK